MPETSIPPTRIVEDRRLDRAALETLCALQGAHKLVRCDLDDSDLSGLVLEDWVFEACSLKRATLIGARLEGTSWNGCKGGLADFGGCELTDARVQASDFNNCSFRRAILTGASFDRCKLTGTNFTETKTLNAVFQETLLCDARLPGVSFVKMRLKNMDFQMADLRKCDFRQAVFEGCSLRDANLAECRFDGADLRGADLGGIKLMNATLFKGATISRAQAGQLLAELGLKVQ